MGHQCFWLHYHVRWMICLVPLTNQLAVWHGGRPWSTSFFFIAPSFAEHALPLLAWSRVMDNQGCSLHHLDQNFPAEGWIVSVRCQEAHMGDKPLLVPLWVCTGKRMNPFPPACNFICQYHIHPLWPWRPQKMRINQVHWICMPIYKASQPNKDQRHSSNSIRLLGGRRNMYRPSAHSRAIL